MTTERILLSEDPGLLPLMKRDLKEMKPLLQHLKSSYEKLELDSFSNSVLKKVEASALSEIKKDYTQQIESQLTKAGITSKVIRENMMRGNQEPFQEFKKAAENVLGFHPRRSSFENLPHLLLEFITYREGVFFISEEDQETILEQHGRIYIETEQEHELYDRLNHFVESYRNLKETLSNIKFEHKGSIQEIGSYFLLFGNGEYSLKPSSIKSAVAYHPLKMKMEKERQERQERMEQRKKAVNTNINS